MSSALPQDEHEYYTLVWIHAQNISNPPPINADPKMNARLGMERAISFVRLLFSTVGDHVPRMD